MIFSTENMTVEDIDFFNEMLPYISQYIEDTKKQEHSIEIICTTGHEDEVKTNVLKLEKMITEGSFAGKQVKIKTLEDYTQNTCINQENIFQEMLDKDIVHEICKGVYAYSGIFLKVYRYFNQMISENGKKMFADIKEYEFPVLYPLEDYQKGGYFESFPHHIMFQTMMKNDIEVIDRFAKDGINDKALEEDMKVPVNVLRHAACVPVYSFLKDTVVEESDPKVFLVSGKCFRNEENNVSELARVNEFYMKEYVFVGTPEQCEQGIEQAKQLWKHWIDIFKLNCKIDTANDSFFASNYKKLKLFQILGNSKQEFKLRLAEDDAYIACGSVNFHRTHFTKPYHITDSTQGYCYSSCCAFGIERLTYALLSQKGLDPEKWDEDTYKEIFG